LRKSKRLYNTRIKDLNNLLDKEKEYIVKYRESIKLLDQRKQEIDEMRSKFHQRLEDKNIRIAYLNNEKHELTERVKLIVKVFRSITLKVS
jgi:uncharacterized protein YeeX (DUF496 family)